jgi:hypothetical protein
MGRLDRVNLDTDEVIDERLTPQEEIKFNKALAPLLEIIKDEDENDKNE